MTARTSKRRFAARPDDPDAWVRAPEPSVAAPAAGDLFTARLTIDVTPELRARIKITAFQRGQTVAVSGMSGNVKQPQVHFEVRKDASPVNPITFLE